MRLSSSVRVSDVLQGYIVPKGCRKKKKSSCGTCFITSNPTFFLLFFPVLSTGCWRYSPRVAEESGRPTTKPTCLSPRHPTAATRSTSEPNQCIAFPSRLSSISRAPTIFSIGSCSGRWNWAGQTPREAAIVHRARVASHDRNGCSKCLLMDYIPSLPLVHSFHFQSFFSFHVSW